MRASYLAGNYTLRDDPRDDSWALTHVDPAPLQASASAAGSGWVPSAFSRDYWAAVAGHSSYRIAFADISCPLLWINSELGYGEQYYGATLAREAGNTNVHAHVVLGYGHSDLLLGRDARREVWQIFNR